MGLTESMAENECISIYDTEKKNSKDSNIKIISKMGVEVMLLL